MCPCWERISPTLGNQAGTSLHGALLLNSFCIDSASSGAGIPFEFNHQPNFLEDLPVLVLGQPEMETRE